MPQKVIVAIDAPIIEPEPYETQMQQDIQQYENPSSSKPSVHMLSTKFGVSRTTLWDQLKGVKPKKLTFQHLQLLTPTEEHKLSEQID